MIIIIKEVARNVKLNDAVRRFTPIDIEFPETVKTAYRRLSSAKISSQSRLRLFVPHHYVIARRFRGPISRAILRNMSSRAVLIKRHPGAQVLVMTCQPDIPTEKIRS